MPLHADGEVRNNDKRCRGDGKSKIYDEPDFYPNRSNVSPCFPCDYGKANKCAMRKNHYYTTFGESKPPGHTTFTTLPTMHDDGVLHSMKQQGSVRQLYPSPFVNVKHFLELLVCLTMFYSICGGTGEKLESQARGFVLDHIWWRIVMFIVTS